MEQAHQFCGGAALGKRNLEWDLNNWKWDGDLFIARQLDPASVPSSFNAQSSNTSSSSSEPEIQRGNLDRKRRVIVINDEEDGDEGGTLSLKLGQSQLDGTMGKRAKFGGGSLSRAACQVEGCCADLSDAKDYHRRHKVCEMHSKVSKALVGNVMQRFCQQCSRFHLLQEFDEGKRSCRRRLAGHNKRRRKTQPETLTSGQPASGEQASNYILISLLRLLSSMQSNNRSDSNTDQDLVAHLMRSLASQSGSTGMNDLLNGAITEGNMGRISALLSDTPPRPPRPTNTHLRVPALASSEKSDAIFLKDSPPTSSEVRDSVVTTTKLNSFDLNDIYIDSDDSQQSSPPQVSGNSDSASTPSPSSSAGEAQGRTDRIVFKLFGKEPSDFPMVLRGQILDWLAHSPTEIESYIRPGCVILTIYLRLAEPIWEELSSDLGSSLSRLLEMTNEPFWRSGWVYTRVENLIAFCYNGRIVIDKSLLGQDSCSSRILSVTPIAVSISERARFQIMGYNLSNPSTRLLCALEGEYLGLEPHRDSTTDEDTLTGDDVIECLDLSCSIPSVTGRGFIEVEDECLSSSFFPFIVAESDVCSEIRMLELILESSDSQEPDRKWEARQQAMDFIHEMGWLLHRCQSKSRLGHQDPNTELFSLARFRQLMEFSMDHDWCAVVKKLLDVLLEGSVGCGEHPSLDAAVSEMGLLHRAVRRNCRALVELLLMYIPVSSSRDSGDKLLFRPDVKGPAGLTPLHIAAGRDGSEAVLDALTDDPGKVGIEAWKTARDSTGATPEDYARLRGHYTYIRMVERKISSRSSTGCVVVTIPEDTSTRAISSLEIATVLSRSLGRTCKGCENKIAYGVAGRSRAYRPAMLSMVAIAAVCVCVALFFKTSPVVYLFRPFRWESLHFGSI